jgi:hypothetical protein
MTWTLRRLQPRPRGIWSKPPHSCRPLSAPKPTHCHQTPTCRRLPPSPRSQWLQWCLSIPSRPPFDHSTDDLGRLGRRVVVRVPIHVGRDCNRRVAELPRDDVESSTCRESQRGVCVAGAVQPDRADAGPAARAASNATTTCRAGRASHRPRPRPIPRRRSRRRTRGAPRPGAPSTDGVPPPCPRPRSRFARGATSWSPARRSGPRVAREWLNEGTELIPLALIALEADEPIELVADRLGEAVQLDDVGM